jgi:hypothetical protein
MEQAVIVHIRKKLNSEQYGEQIHSLKINTLFHISFEKSQ